MATKREFEEKFEEIKKEYYKYFNYSEEFDISLDDEIEIQKNLPYSLEERIMYSILHLKNLAITQAKLEEAEETIENQNIIINKALKLIEQSDYKEVDNFSPIHIDMAITTLKDKK
jgi:hypothetical protein